MLLFVDQLCNVDFSYLDAERGLVGETWIASIELEGALDEQGMVCDFGTVKSFMRKWLDENIDHKLLIPTQSSHASVSSTGDADTYEWRCEKGVIRGSGPSQAHCLVESEIINPDTVAQWCIARIKAHFPESVSALTLRFVPETIQGPFYHYSHGLKKHGGNCQRIAHGHRSKIEIWKNGLIDIELMKAHAQLWEDIYIGTEEDLIEPLDDAQNYHFRYAAQQGSFQITLPRDMCYLITSESTVEYIAKHIADKLKERQPEHSFRVKAYEGLAKGAIASID